MKSKLKPIVADLRTFTDHKAMKAYKMKNKVYNASSSNPIQKPRKTESYHNRRVGKMIGEV